MYKFKKQIAFMFGAVALISYLSFQYYPVQENDSKPVISVKNEGEHMQIFLLDHENTLVPLTVPASVEMSEEDKLQIMVAYLSGKQKVPNFKPLFTKECKTASVKIKDGVVTMDFDQSFKNYEKENELRVLEALTWGATQFHDVERVKLSMNGKVLTQMPNAQTPIPDVLNRSIGMNHFETATSALHKSTSITVFYTKKINGKQYMVPKSKRVESTSDGLKVNVQHMLDDISVSSSLTQPLYTNDVQLNSFQFKDGTIMLDLNKNMLGSDKQIKQDVYHSLLLSLSALMDVKKIEIRVDGVNVTLDDKTQAVSVYDLSYNEVIF